jgi:hypothetical protein
MPGSVPLVHTYLWPPEIAVTTQAPREESGHATNTADAAILRDNEGDFHTRMIDPHEERYRSNHGNVMRDTDQGIQVTCSKTPANAKGWHGFLDCTSTGAVPLPP